MSWRLWTGSQAGRTPLHAACSCGHVDVVAKLLIHGASVNAVDEVCVCAASGVVATRQRGRSRGLVCESV